MNIHGHNFHPVTRRCTRCGMTALENSARPQLCLATKANNVELPSFTLPPQPKPEKPIKGTRKLAIA